MQEFRWDGLHQRWVIIAAKRAFRPGSFSAETATGEAARCPFCAGRESETPKPLYVDAGAGFREDEPWRIRVVPNLYEAVSMALPEAPGNPRRTLPARGMHEVVVESPRHDDTLTGMSVDHLAAVFLAFQVRLQAAHGAGLAYAQIFKNHGREAGASMPHPHSQLIALPFVPPLVAAEQAALQAGKCFLCEAFRDEAGGERSLFETEHFWAWVPPAGAAPYESVVMPKAHEENFHAAGEARLTELAEAVQRVWGATEAALPGAPMNLLLHTAPFSGGGYHWHWEIVPRVTRLAGFEMATGCHVNPSSPEASARRLKEALAARG